MKRREFLKTSSLVAGVGMVPMFRYLPASAAGRDDTVVVVLPNGPNSMDIHRSGTNRPSYAIAVNVYDRLVSFGTKVLENGTSMYNYQDIVPELAESWELAPDGMSMTFSLRKDATFHDGSPVTAEDVKWSFDRAVSVGGFPTVQMKAGSLEKPEQFSVVDPHTFKIDFIRKSKLTLPDVGVPVPIIINSKAALKQATEKDPWALEYMHRNPLGGGAFMVDRWDPGVQIVYQRFDDWKSGPMPGVERVIVREVPSASTRRALIEKGDADISLDLPARDFRELADGGKVVVQGAPIENSMYALGLNMNFEPFKNKLVRQAVAYSIPYKEIFEAAAYGRGVPMYGGKSMKPATIDWPQPYPYDTDYARAKELLAEAGYKDGFEVPISFNLGFADWSEPAALLVQEGLGKIGVKSTLDKVPGANWRTKALVEKSLPMHMKNFGGWLNFPDYYFFWVYQHGHLFNSMNYRNEEVEALVAATLNLPIEDPAYEPNVKRMLEIAFDEVPLIPFYQPFLDVATQKNVKGYEYWFHRQLDVRNLSKGSV
jgi:peptide/nickel transport system substrate-binding protein